MFSDHQQFFKKFSISDAVIAYKKPRCTIMKYIRDGSLELDYNKLLDYQQLVKKFGELPISVQDEKDEQIKKLKNEILNLKKQMNHNVA